MLYTGIHVIALVGLKCIFLQLEQTVACFHNRCFFWCTHKSCMCWKIPPAFIIIALFLLTIYMITRLSFWNNENHSCLIYVNNLYLYQFQYNFNIWVKVFYQLRQRGLTCTFTRREQNILNISGGSFSSCILGAISLQAPVYFFPVYMQVHLWRYFRLDSCSQSYLYCCPTDYFLRLPN